MAHDRAPTNAEDILTIPPSARSEDDSKIKNTAILQDPKEIVDKIRSSIEPCSQRIAFCTSIGNMRSGYALLLDAYKTALSNMKSNEAAHGFRWITQLENERDISVVSVLLDLGVNIRHSRRPLILQFGIMDSSNFYSMFESTDDTGRMTPAIVVFSNESGYIRHSELVFEELWNNGIDARARVKEILEGTANQRTEVLDSADKVLTCLTNLVSNSREKYCMYGDRNIPAVSFNVEPYSRFQSELKERGVKLQYILDITKENVQYCKRMIAEVNAEIRHQEGIKGFFIVSDGKEYIANGSEVKGELIPNAIYSNIPQVVEQNQILFDAMWDRAVPAVQKIYAIENGVQTPETKIVRAPKEIEVLISGFLQRANSSYVRALSDKRVPTDVKSALEHVQKMHRQNPNFKFQLITDLQKENLEYCKGLVIAGVELRHMDGNKAVFAISKEEYLTTEVAAMEEQLATGAVLPCEIMWSNRLDVISQTNQMFQMMWKLSIPAEIRISQLESGIEPEETRLIGDIEEAFEIGKKMNEECNEEVLMILPSEMPVTRNAELFRKLSQKQMEKGFKIRILVPSITPAIHKVLPGATFRKLDASEVTILIYDRKRMFLTQYSDPKAKATEDAVSSNIYTTNRQTIAGIVSVFNALWRESELREAEERTRRQAQLLQDILTHDIRNFNQISRLSAELIQDRLLKDPEGTKLLESLLQAIDGSTELIERGKKLGRILSEESSRLHPIDLMKSLQESLTLIRRAYTDKRIREETTIISDRGSVNADQNILVNADELLLEVFTNLFSNSAKYTDGEIVPIKIHATKDHDYWIVSITDQGAGIPENMRSRIFDRYLVGAKGSGLGLSIVHALVVHRYHGRVELAGGADERGTRVKIWLPVAHTSDQAGDSSN